jgi:dTDP-glucose 4,6-dehydratase
MRKIKDPLERYMGKKKLLVTGSGGFVLSNFIRFVLKNNINYEIVSIDKCLLSNTINTLYSNRSHRFQIGDVADKHFVNTIFEIEKPDIVIHGADSKDNIIYNNIEGTQVIINACLKWDVKKLIYTSTDKVYGQLLNENQDPWTENSTTNPNSNYAVSKLCAELLIKNSGLKYNIIRSCNNYGPRQSKFNFIPTIISGIINNSPIFIYDKGLHIRDWIYVQDNCSAILKIMEEAPDNEIYNVSARQEYSNIEVFHEITKIMNKGYELLQFVEEKNYHDFRRAIDNKKVLDLGWKPLWKFKNEGLNAAQDWINNNQWFLKS